MEEFSELTGESPTRLVRQLVFSRLPHIVAALGELRAAGIDVRAIPEFDFTSLPASIEKLRAFYREDQCYFRLRARRPFLQHDLLRQPRRDRDARQGVEHGLLVRHAHRQVAEGDDPNQLPVVIHDRQAAHLLARHDLARLLQDPVRVRRDRVVRQP